jgi:hypothetical protein
MKPVLDTAVPALVIVSMTIVGLGLTTVNFCRVVRQPRAYSVCRMLLLLAAAAACRSLWIVGRDVTAGASRS